MSAPAPAGPRRRAPALLTDPLRRLVPVAALVLAVAAAVALLGVGDQLPFWLQLLLWTAFALGIPVMTAHEWCRVPGPLLFFELLRCARRDRYLLFRAAYGFVLLGILSWSYLSWFVPLGGDPLDALLGEVSIPAADLSKFAGHFFTAFLDAQLVVVLILTPIYTGGAIAEEKERRTLEFLLATDLSSAEIVVSKLAARLLNLGLLVLTGLPVLALTELWGGVDPLLLVLAFTATALTMFSVGSLSVLNSVFARHPLEAVLRTYGQLALFLTVGFCIPGLNLGHPLLVFGLLAQGAAVKPMALLGGYAMVHLGAASLLLLAAVQLLRTAAHTPPAVPLPDPGEVVEPGAVPARFPPRAPLPPVEDSALLWKELHAEPHLRWEEMHPLLAGFFLFAGVCVASIGLTLVLTGLGGPWLEMAQPVNLWVRAVGTILTAGMLLLVAFYAAGSVSRERERQTLDGLRTLPDDSRDLLRAKWLGGFLSARNAWWCLGAVWGLGLATGALNVLALPLVLLAWAVYTAFTVSLGLYCSTVCRSTVRATVTTVVVLLVLGLMSGLLHARGGLLGERPEGVAGWLAWWVLYGQSTLVPLWVLAFRYDEFWAATQWGSWDRVVAAVAGLAFYALAAWALWRLALAHFRAQAGPAPRGPANRR